MCSIGCSPYRCCPLSELFPFLCYELHRIRAKWPRVLYIKSWNNGFIISVLRYFLVFRILVYIIRNSYRSHKARANEDNKIRLYTSILIKGPHSYDPYKGWPARTAPRAFSMGNHTRKGPIWGLYASTEVIGPEKLVRPY